MSKKLLKIDEIKTLKKYKRKLIIANTEQNKNQLFDRQQK